MYLIWFSDFFAARRSQVEKEREREPSEFRRDPDGIPLKRNAIIDI